MSDEHTKNKLEWLEAVACDARLPGSATRIAVLLATKFLNRKKQMAWPSMTRIADELGITRQGAQKSVNALIDRGYLDREMGGGRRNSNRYRLKRSSQQVPTPVGSFEASRDREKPPTAVGSNDESANHRCQKEPTRVGRNPSDQPNENTQSGRFPHEMTEDERVEFVHRTCQEVGYPKPKGLVSTNDAHSVADAE